MTEGIVNSSRCRADPVKEGNGIELLEFARKKNPKTKVMVSTAFGTLERAEEAFQ